VLFENICIVPTSSDEREDHGREVAAALRPAGGCAKAGCGETASFRWNLGGRSLAKNEVRVRFLYQTAGFAEIGLTKARFKLF
jgi:hypothetical protein